MTNLVSTPAISVTDPESTIPIDGWFPDISLGNIRKTIRMGEGIVSHERLRAAVEGAVITSLIALGEWRAAHILAGSAALDDIDTIMIGDRTRAVILWERAIRYYTAAEIADNHRDITATEEGNIRSDEENITADEYRRQAHNAIADLLSIGADIPTARNAVELI